eukprot:1140136-Pyramimonas_sp.AAC.1
MAQPWAIHVLCVKDPNQAALLRMARERRALTPNITYHLARRSAPVGKHGGILNVALHHNASIRPVITLRM